MPSVVHRQRAFTIVEMLVVISIIAVMLGLLLPALTGVRNRAKKTEELSRIRQVNVAWNLYANANNDAALPGYLEPEVQQRWRVSYKFPDGSKVPPAPNFSGSDPNLAGPWTWRLMPYLDYSHDVVHYYSSEENPDILAISEPDEAEEIAMHPAFGYNGHYIGGWYELRTFEDPSGDPYDVAMTRFTTAEGVGLAGQSSGQANLVAKSPSSINRPNEIVMFCSSAQLPVGIVRDILDDMDGYHFVEPPNIQGSRLWGHSRASTFNTPSAAASSTSESNAFEVFDADTAAPIGRYDGMAVVLYADGHVGQETPLGLDDMRVWVDDATSKHWFHR